MRIQSGQKKSLLRSVPRGCVHQGVQLCQQKVCEALCLLSSNLRRQFAFLSGKWTSYLSLAPRTHLKQEQDKLTTSLVSLHKQMCCKSKNSLC